MRMELGDGTGTGASAEVNSENRLLTQALSLSPQQHVALEHGQVYQVRGEDTVTVGATYDLLFIENTSSTLNMVITYIRAQYYDFAGGAAVPNAATYFEYGYGQTHTSGGTAVVPVNTNAGSSNLADVAAYEGSPVLGGTLVSLDEEVVKSEAEVHKWNKEGSVVIPPGKTFGLRLVTDNTSGEAWARVSFLMTTAGG